MTTIIGEALFLIFGNQDVMVIVAAFLIAVSLLYIILASWKFKP